MLGFIAVFAAQLSFWTLVLVTILRFFAAVFPFQVRNHVKLKHSISIILSVWVYSIIVAILPTTGKVSSYSKIAICLPFDVSTKVSQGYVVWFLIAYVVMFFVIVACYIKIYIVISKKCPGRNRNNVKIQAAKRMFLQIFSNFLCWLPISMARFLAMFTDLSFDVDVAKFLIVFIFPLNACTNPFLYVIFTKLFRDGPPPPAARPV